MTKKADFIKATRKQITLSRCSTYWSKRKFMFMLADKSTSKIVNHDELVAACNAADQLIELLKKTEKNLDEQEAVELEIAKVDAEIVTAVAIENLETETGHMCLYDVNGKVDEDSEVFSMY
jgi:hypothetical protein